MQISVNSLLNHGHPYYRIDNIEIYLDGVKQTHVYEIDTLGTLNNPKGWIKKYKQNEDGTVATLGGDFLEETLYGDVEIKVKDNIPNLKWRDYDKE